MKNLFFLIKPDREEDPARLQSYRSKPLKQWLAELPTANHGKTTRLFQEYIEAMNRVAIDGENRLAALELLRPTYYSVYEFLLSRISCNGFPLAENDQKVGQLLIDLSTEFSTGYWLALSELADKGSSWRGGRLLPVPIQRVMRGLVDILMIRYFLRLPEPDWLWMDLHVLFELAVDKQKTEVKIKGGSGAGNDPLSIADTYKQALLLHLCCPYGLMQSEILNLYRWLGEWVRYATIDTGGGNVDDFSYQIPIAEDKPPFRADSESSAQGEGEFRCLRLGGLINRFPALEKKADSALSRFDLKAMSESSTISFELLQYLKARWSGIELEGTTLFCDRHERLLAVGLKSTHQQLSPDSLGDEEMIAEWQVSTSSARTLCCEFDRPGQIAIGNLVSLARVGASAGKRNLGVICKLSMARMNGPVHLEITELTPQVFAAGIQPLNNKQDSRVYQRALLYLNDSSETGNTSLILASQKLKDGNMVRLLTQNGPFPVVLENHQTIGLGYMAFTCRVVREKKTATIPNRGYDFL